MSVYIRETARELGKLGHKVDVFTRVHDPKDPLTESLGKNATLVHLSVGGNEPIHKLVLYSYLPDFACALENYRRSHNLVYDLIFSHYWLSGEAGREVHGWWHAPHVTMFHTLGLIKNSLGVGEEEPELRLESEKGLARTCDRVIAATEREKNTLVSECGAAADRISVIPCGVNMDLFHPISRSAAREMTGMGDARTVLFVGRIEPLKGIDSLLRAFAGLPESSSARLVLIGGDDGSRKEIDQLKALASTVGIESRVNFVGTVKHELMPYYYNAADVCVVPSHYESFGLVPLEALACGTPVVATDVGDLQNIIREGETGYVVPVNGPETLTAKIAEVLSWPDRNLTRSRAIRASVKDLSWSSVASRISDEFETLVPSSPVTAAK
jgi:D-inositol-3-phosphate glycosyltransferase